MRASENEVVYSTKDMHCKHCGEVIEEHDEYEECKDCSHSNNLGLIQDKDGAWYIDPALMGDF